MANRARDIPKKWLLIIVFVTALVTIGAIANDSDKILNQSPAWQSYPPPYEITAIPYYDAYPAPIVVTTSFIPTLTPTFTASFTPTASGTLSPTPFPTLPQEGL